ncbi:hypothetical protein F966_03323 [Acinetobacter higginsii]|uniref:Uncharacterized protein n=1 Tax=Acinetobacter higginsii TaxID=70347 RepID=N8XHX2_9GAMM|nr:hypothetical protein F966_03323 [Acinetobacter higginsii]
MNDQTFVNPSFPQQTIVQLTPAQMKYNFLQVKLFS